MSDPHALTSPEAQRCPLCGGWNHCTPASTGSLEGDCWCRTARIAPQALAAVPEALRMKACLCPACAAQVSPPPPATDGTHAPPSARCRPRR